MRKLFTLKVLLIPVILGLSLISNFGFGQVAAWNTNGQTAYGTQGLSPSSKDANVTVIGLTRGSGVTTTPTAAGNVWGGNGWSTVSSADAITNNKFITFSITPNTGFKMSLSSINPFLIRISSTGPINILLQYQVGTGAFQDITTQSITRPGSTSNFSLTSTDLSGFSALQNVSAGTTITFRIVPYLSTSSAGVFYIGNQTNVNALAINGTVISSNSSDATLSNLQLSAGSIAFSPLTTSYTLNVANSVSSTTVTPTANESHATITINGTPVTSGSASSSISLAVGDNIITTIVTAQDGTATKTYTVTVNRASAGTPTITQTSSLTDFGNVCINTTAGPNSFTIDGSNLDGTNINIAALSGFSYSETSGGTYSSTLSFSYTGSSFTGKIIYVKFTPTAVQSYNGNINLSGGGVTSYSVPVTGSGVNTAPAVTTGGVTVSGTTVTLNGSITAIGCNTVSGYGFEYSVNTGFADGSGTPVSSSNLSGGNFSGTVSGLIANKRYYYKAFATSNSTNTYGSQQAFNAPPVPVVLSAQPGLSFTEDFSDIINWQSFFAGGVGSQHFSQAISTGSAPSPNPAFVSSNSVFSTGSSGGVQKGTDQSPATQSIVLLSTGSPDNTTSAAFDFYMDFTGVNAGNLSFDYQTIYNSPSGTPANDTRPGSLRVYATTDGINFSEISFASVLNFINNSPINGSKTNISLPASFNNSSTARLRFYYYNGSTGSGAGSRPKISIDNLTVTAVATTPCSTPTSQPTSLVFGTINDVSISGSFTAASPAPDQYLTVVSTNSSLTSNPSDGTTYNVGDALGDGTVVAKGSSTNFTATGLSASTTYYFFTFAVNGICTGGPKYNITNPLTGTANTTAGLPPCTAPTSQPSNLIFSGSTLNSVQGSFTATTADEYLVVRSTSAALTFNPVNGQVYNSGDIVGNGTVVQRGAATSFTANGLSPSTQYYFFIFSLNTLNCVNGPTYNTNSPLSGTQTTQPLPPCSKPLSQSTYLTLNASNTSVSGAFNGSTTADDYLIIRSTLSSLSASPVDNIDYAVGSSFGGGTVIGNDSVKSFATTNLTPGTTYYFYIFAANKNCSGGTKYLSTSPLTGNATTTNALVNNYYFGTLHSHSDYSDGNQDHPGYTPANDYNYAMTANCMDFLGISEHNHFSSPNNPGNSIQTYHLGIAQADSFTTANPNFLALYGMEWGVISGGGHVVVYGDGMNSLFGWESGSGGWGPTNNYDVYVPKSTYIGPTGLFKVVNDSVAQNTFATLAHPNQTDFNNLAGIAYSDTADNAITGVAVESGPATSTNTTYSNPGSPMYYLWYYQTLLSKGYHLGPTIDHDNHNTTFGHTTHSRTAVVAPALTKTELIKAMRNMHFYATEDCDSKVDFTINTKMMGTIFSDRNAPAISATLSDATTSTSSAIIRVMFGTPGSGIMPVKIDSVVGNTLYFVDNNLANGSTGYYYVDITNGSTRIVTSPIWYTRADVASPLSTTYYPRTSATDLSQAGNWTDDPAGTAGTSPAGFTSANQLFNITRNAVVSGAWMISGGTNVVLSVSGLIFSPTSSLTIGSGSNFDFGGNNNYSTTFKSIQTNTAYLGQLTGTISNANNVTVERYISSQNNRAYRLLAPSVNTATSIHYNWQENASGRTDNPTPTYGTHITGTTVDQTNGFDVTSTGQGSLFTYNQTGGGSWVPATNTNATTLDAKTGYLLYIRGDRSIDLTSQSSPLPSTNTTLRTFGSLLQGTQTYTGLASNDFSLVTNPYASAINWNSIYNHAGTNNSTSFANYYTYWDPNIGSRGGYVTVTDGGTVSPTPSGGLPAGTVNIQSGQAFFVLSTTVSPTLTIQESDKSTTNNIDVFRTATPAAQKFTTSLYYNDAEHGRRLADGVTSLYDDSYNKAIDGNDAEEIPNWDENIAIARGGKQLSIEERPTITASDTLLLSMSNMKQQGYEFEFTPTGLNPNTIAVLIDNYSGAKTILDVTKTTVVPFTVTSAAASSATDRFYVIFKISGALPVTLTGVKAYQKNAGVQVEWTTQQEINTDRYELERATGVQPFTKIGTVSAKGNSSVSNYSLYDASPFSGVNFYRIKIIDKAGQVTYSDVVKVNISSQSNQITVTPNPVHSNTITLQMINMQKGSYTISLTNKLGQVVASKVIDHADGSSTETLTPSKAMSSGVYQLRVTGNGTSITRQVLKD